MVSDILKSVDAYSRSLKYLFYPWVFKYLLLSGLISLVVFAILGYIIFYFGGGLGLELLDVFFDNGGPKWLQSLMSWLAKILLWILLFLILKYIVLIVSAPFMSALSERLEERLSPGYKDPKPNQLYSTARGVRLATSNIVREIFYTIPIFILSFFMPFVVALIFFVQSYFAGFGYLDFFLERRFNSKEARRFVSRHKGVAIGNGSIFLLLFLVPVVGAFVAPTLATIAGTLTCVELVDDNDF